MTIMADEVENEQSLDDRLTEAIRIRNAMMAFVKTEGWDMMVQYLNTQYTTRLKLLLEAGISDEGFLQDGMAQAMLQEYRRGATAMLQAIMQYPQDLIDINKEFIDNFKGSDEDQQPQQPQPDDISPLGDGSLGLAP